VITNLFSAIPLVGQSIVTWLWGGFAVDNPTLNRFFSLHYLLPFVIFAVVFLHLWALHHHKSNNPLGIDIKGPQDTIPFHPYYTVKDNFGIGVFLIVYAAFVFFAPNFFGEPDNYIKANPLQTPPHIVPEWYFLPYYAILRATPDNFIGNWMGFTIVPAKLAGVILMFGSIIVLMLLPWLDRSPVRSARFRPVYKWFFWIHLFVCFVLGYCGANPPEGAYVVIARIGTAWYFFHFIILLPLLSVFERPDPLPHSISEPVLKGGGFAAAAAPAKPMEKA
jgi:quinol-cytochrome oxidoreductase complex cytochrome b subunit